MNDVNKNIKYSGTFITFEGGEGSGKTTQINKIANTLTRKGYKVLTTREPGGTPEAEKLRELITQKDGGAWSPLAETLLLLAARTMHIENKILPALKEGKIVICDRFIDSTMAYQGYGRDFNLKQLTELNNIATGGLIPDLTFIMDIDPETGLNRTDLRAAASALGVEPVEDKFETMAIEFHKKIRKAFLDIGKKEPQRCVVVDASQDVLEISEIILKKTLNRLSR